MQPRMRPPKTAFLKATLVPARLSYKTSGCEEAAGEEATGDGVDEVFLVPEVDE